MTISVSPERSTLTLPGLRARPEDGATVRAGPNGISQAPHQRQGAAPVTVPRGPETNAVALRATTFGLDRASSVTDAALGGASAVVELLGQVRGAVAAGRGAEAASLLSDVSSVVSAAEFDGANLLNGALTGGLRVPVSSDDEITVAAHDLRPGGPLITLDLASDRAAAVSQADVSLARAQGVVEALQDESKRLGAHRAFVALLSESVTGGKTDLDVEGARLAALQIKQTLGGTSLALSSAAPQSVLALFR